jgi:excisionase family DNA binding protein
MTSAIEPVISPDNQRAEVVRIYKALKQGPAAIIDADGQRLPLPQALYAILVQAARELELGRGVSLVSSGHELTSQQAAEVLNVSRPFLIRLLDEEHIPYHMVGTHRRIALEDLLAFRESRSKARKTALGKMAREAQKSGDYA